MLRIHPDCSDKFNINSLVSISKGTLYNISRSYRENMQPWGRGCAVSSINIIISIFREGDITKLIADLIVNPTNESLNDKNPLSERIHKSAGPLLKEECRTNLMSKYLAHV